MTLQQFYENMIKLSLYEAGMSDDNSPLKLICE